MPSALELFPHQSSTRADVNRLDASDRSAHDLYRFVLSFPPHLVRDYLARFSVDQTATVLDPFCGTGTTLAVRVAYGMAENADPLAFLLELNLACAAKEKAGEKITPPGLPLSEAVRCAFVTEDCVRLGEI